ncbi:DUF1857 family protein [Saccharothrix sp. 6-C]|uniref:AtaL-like protein n=1 Tax=Saccharothrix sp. 6-C TaxID=2781735 RepID=UPI00191766D9|nr:AtaL-like protein [Saccharothrix sp. 6-C]QQQ79558.1 DUF1857 family protein [Saccharothrix sp. 6-C]
MTVTITHTVPIPLDPAGPRPDFDEIWRSMLHKAENPVEFVPSITECRVVERYDDGFVREVVFWGVDRVLERVTPERERGRILFEVIDHPEMVMITNELTEDATGRYSFTLTYVLSEGRGAKLRAESEFIDKFEDVIRETAATTVVQLGRTATGSPAQH